jgi:outer membrane protein, heavy metal efflux system
MMRRVAGWGVGLFLALSLESPRVVAQNPTIEPPDTTRVPGSTSLGPLPGSGGTRGGAPADLGIFLGGRPGPSVPRVPSAISVPGPGFAIPPGRGITVPPVAPMIEGPPFGPLEFPPGAEEIGPPGGLTLDVAIERLVRENLDLRAQFHEISKARADILTAGLRANPIFYADSQLIPYGNFSKARPGGPNQFDINISYPLDLARKWQARTRVACQAQRVLEAQYQDAVRQQIDRLSNVYVAILGARETVRYAQASVTGLTQLLDRTQKLQRAGERSRSDVERIKIQLNSARIGLADAEEALRNTKRSLTPLLRIPLAVSETLELRGAIADRAPPPPLGDELIQLALACRPDLAAARLGIGRAEADMRLAQAERFQDVYLLYQPYTFQNNTPFDAKSARSWALGVTVPMPLYNRNQGNIQRARVNVSQTQTQRTALELRVCTEVRQAEREYAITRSAVAEIEQVILPGARQVRDETLRRYNQGEAALVDYLVAQREYNDIVRQYRDTQVRHRRSMLALNTAVGQRILP